MEQDTPISTRGTIIRMLPKWKQWYMRRNQPGNYFRVTRIIPPVENAVNLPYCWIQKFQVWSPKGIILERNIDADAYNAIAALHGFEEGFSGNMDYAIYRNPHRIDD